MKNRLHDLITRTLADPHEGPAVLALVGTEAAAAHVDDEQLAAALDHHPTARTVAHALRCTGCAEDIEALLTTHAVVPFDTATRLPALLRPRRPVATLFAHLVTAADGALEIREATGLLRVQPALAVRADRPLEAVSFRDRERAAQLEIAVVQEPDLRRVSLLVKWLGTAHQSMVASASSRGRTVAETDMFGGSAMLSNLRKCPLRVDVRREDTVVAVGWLHFDAIAP